MKRFLLLGLTLFLVAAAPAALASEEGGSGNVENGVALNLPEAPSASQGDASYLPAVRWVCYSAYQGWNGYYTYYGWAINNRYAAANNAMAVCRYANANDPFNCYLTGCWIR